MNRYDIVALRLRNQRLSFPNFRRPVDLLHWFGAVQAQDFNGAKWAIGQRMRNATDRAIERAYNEGKILRTHLLRPTWHFVAPDDIRWLLQLTAARVNSASRSNYRKLELDDRAFKRCNSVLSRALKGGKHLTRASLRKILADSGVAVNDPIRLAHILLRAELEGIICSGPKIGNQFTYALLDERVPEGKSFDRDQNLAKLTRRYFRSHGPATLKDYVWWSGLTVADAKKGIAMVEKRLSKISWRDKVYWGPPKTDAVPSLKSAHLLPAFDEYTVAYKNRDAILDRSHTKLSIPSSGLLGPVIILNGEAVGNWTKRRDTNSTAISLTLYRTLTKPEKSLVADAVDRYAAFFGLSSDSREEPPAT